MKKRRQTSRLSTQKRRADVAFRHSLSDSARARNGDVPLTSLKGSPQERQWRSAWHNTGHRPLNGTERSYRSERFQPPHRVDARIACPSLPKDRAALEAACDRCRFFVDGWSQMVEGVLGSTRPNDRGGCVRWQGCSGFGGAAGMTICAGKAELCTRRIGG